MSRKGLDGRSNLSLPLPNSSVTTITTPTLTPTTLRLIEDILGNSGNPSCPLGEPIEHQYQAGFVPPTVTPSITSDSCDSQFDSDDLSRGASPSLPFNSGNNSNSSNSGSSKDKIPLDDEERKRIRRERNKQAAARCRQRRIEYTNKLARETEELETGNAALKNTLSLLLEQKTQLEATLRMHSQQCRQVISSS